MAAVCIPGNLQGTAGQIQPGAALRQPQAVAGHQGGAGAGAAGQGGTGAPFPDPHHQVGGTEHLHEVDVGAGRKGRMDFKAGAEALQIDGRHGSHRDDHMGVAHAGGRHREAFAAHLQLSLGNTGWADLERGGHRLGLKEGGTHVHPDPTIRLELGNDATGQGFDLPAAARLIAVAVGEEAGETTNAIAAHLRLGAVGVEDAHPQLAAFPGRQGQDHPIAPHAETAVAELLHRIGGETETSFRIL